VLEGHTPGKTTTPSAPSIPAPQGGVGTIPQGGKSQPIPIQLPRPTQTAPAKPAPAKSAPQK
jgi:hypothetical protein